MLNMDDIIIEEFGEENLSELKLFFDKYDLTEKIRLYLGLINNHIERIEEELAHFGFINVSALASLLLVESNALVGSFPDDVIEQKNDLKNKLGSFYQRVLAKLVTLHSTPKQKEAFVMDIFYALFDVCILKTYDIADLFDFLKLPSLDNELLDNEAGENEIGESVIDPDKVYERGVPGYISKMNEVLFTSFPSVLAEFKICEKPEEFMKLFDDPDENLAIELNEKKANFVLQFLSYIHNMEFVGTYGKWGFYQVLQFHIKDFDSIFLKNRGAKRRVDTIKNLKQYESNLEKIENRFKLYL